MPGRRQVLLGLVGMAVAGCSLGNPNNPVVQTTPQPTTPGITPTPTIAPGTTHLVYTEHSRWVNDLAWSPDSNFIVSYPDDGFSDPNIYGKMDSIRVWNAGTGQDRFTLPA